MISCCGVHGIAPQIRYSTDEERSPVPHRTPECFRHRVFNQAAAAISVPGLTPHDLRHTAASLAVQAGANVKVVEQMLGHASAAMTLDVYAGLFGDDLDAVADRLHEAATRETADSVRT